MRKYSRKKDAVKKNKLKGREVSEEKKEKDRWANLPDDLLEPITRRLCLADCLGLREVCSSWRSTIANAIADRFCHPLPQPPLVVLHSARPQFQDPLFYRAREIYYDDDDGCLCSFDSRGPVMCQVESEKDILGTVEGWLIMCDNLCDKTSSSLFFYFLNPVTHSRISVKSELNYPSNSPLDRNKLDVVKLVASSKPHSSRCFLVTLFNDYCHIAFCRLFNDEPWTMIEREKTTHFMDVEVMGSKLYARTHTSILVYDMDEFSNNTKPDKIALLPPTIPQPISSYVDDDSNLVHIHGGVTYYMTKDDALEELFLIAMRINTTHDSRKVGYLNMISEFITQPEIINIEVFKLCLRNNNGENNKNHLNVFVKVDNLGDRGLFLNGWRNMLISSSGKFDEKLIKKNSIYFAILHHCPNDPWEGFQMGVFGLADKKFKYHRSDYYYYNEEPPSSTWFVPSLW